MAAKLLHSLTDDNPDLQKQIGCMTGIFQLFDRQHIIAGRRLSGHSSQRLPPGSSHYKSCAFETESHNRHRRPPVDKHSNKNVQEKQRVSTESSRASFSSSSRSSSFSSLDCNKKAQPEPLSFDRIIFPETPSRDPTMSQSSVSPQFGRQSLDLQDVVRDSMYREIRGLSVKTTIKEEAADRVVKHGDSPRPLQLSKINDGAYTMGLNRKQNLPVDLKESLRVLAKLREAPWNFDEPRLLSRSSSYQLKDGSLLSVPKDAPRFSYDGREVNHLSFEPRDTTKPILKLKELPRLSLDGRESSMHSFNSDSKSNFVSRISQRDRGNSSDVVLSQQKKSGTPTRPPTVVAKLMGLETLPDSASASDSKMASIKALPVEDSGPFLRSSKRVDLCRPVQISNSSMNSWKEPTSPRWKNPDSIMKPISRFPIEPAPWRQLDGTRSSQRPASRHLKTPAKAANNFPSVYSEIEKRLKDLEFTQSGKDLRALKQILEAMQAKGLLDTRKEEHHSNYATQKDHEHKYSSPTQNARLLNQRKPRSGHIITSANRGNNSLNGGNNSLRTSESPIIIMKPTKLVEKCRFSASSVLPLGGLSSPPKVQGGDCAYNRKNSVNSRTAKDQIPKSNRGDHVVISTDVKTNSRTLKLTQTSIRPHQLSKESATSSGKSSGSVSPRLQQKKLELENRSRLPTPPSDSSKSRRQSNKQQPESNSPGGRHRPKYSNFQQREGQFSEIGSETMNLSYQENHISQQSDGRMVSDSEIDIEVASSERSGEINGSQSPTMHVAEYSVTGFVQMKSTSTLSEDESVVELAAIAPEYPSPVSVLDEAMYIDDAPSPVKQVPKTLKDDGTRNSNGDFTKERWNSADNHISNTIGSGLTSEINRKKLQNIEHLVQKLRRLNSGHDEARTDYIASLCENTNPDHRYISEILLASGLLLRDLGSSLTTFQFHPSGHPINPELFLVLEQTKASTLLKEECSTEKVVQLKPDKEKFHRKLIFDAVNEILVKKLALVGHSPEPWFRPDKLAKKTPNAQKLLRELCLEIEQFQAKKPECRLEDEEDGLKNILWEDVVHRSESWTDFHCEISTIVLDVERSIFKDLVNEIVIGEAAGLRMKPGRHCRQLFVK